jgi:predicted permease
MMSLRQDLRHAIRVWISSPGLTLVILVSLTLSLGAANAVFTFVDALLLRPLPVRAPNELFAVGSTTGDLNLNPRYFSPEFYRDLTQRDPAFPDLIASSVAVSSGVNLSADGSAARLSGELVSGNYFRMLGVSAQAGRTISDADDLPGGASAVVVLSDAAWRRRFGGRSDAVGQVVRLNDHPYTIVGVASRAFFGTRPGFNPDLWIPMGMVEQIAGDTAPSRNSNYIELMLRMRSGSSTTEKESRLTAAYQEWIRTTSVDGAPPAALRLVSAAMGLSLLRGQFGQPVTILMSAVVMLLAIACANVANLLLSRGMARRREIAIRLSQGATPLRIARQFITECLLLAIVAGSLGWLTAVVMERGFLSFLPTSVAAEQFAPSVRVFLFSGGLVIASGFIFGLLPSRMAAQQDLAQALRRNAEEGRRVLGRSEPQDFLSVLQVALSLVLVISSVQFTRTLYNLKSADMGFRQDDVLLAALDPVKSGYSAERTRLFYDQLLEHLRAQPAVRAAGLAAYGSLSGVMAAGTRFVNTQMHADGQTLTNAVDATVYLNNVTPGYLDAVGIRVLRGRDFTRHDTSSTQKVVVINETAARFFFGDASPLGRRIGAGRVGGADLEVIGVVSDAKYLNLREEARRIVYRPLSQAFRSLMTLHVKAVGDPAALADLVQHAVHALDVSMPVFNVQTMRGRIDESLQPERLVATLAGGLSLIGTILAMVGVYGVVNYAVTRQRRALAIRIAIGGRPRQILTLVLRRSLLVAAFGLLLGIPLAIAALTSARALLYGVTSTDPRVVVGAAGLVALVTLGAGYVPARRATRIDPLIVLRDE